MTNVAKTYIPSWFQRKRLFSHICINCGRERLVPYDRWIADSLNLRMCGSTCIKAFYLWRKRDWVNMPHRGRPRHPADWPMVKGILARGGTIKDVAGFLSCGETAAADYVAREAERESCLLKVPLSSC